MATEPHVVGPGEYLTSIAYARGVTTDDIWNHADNASLRQQRDNPEQLAAGDVVYIPTVERQWAPVSAGETKDMVADPTKVTVDMVLEQLDDDGKNALAGKTYRIEGSGQDQVERTIGNDGAISFEVPVTVHEVMLVVEELSLTCPIVVGGMDPVDERSGLHQRLRQLGYTDEEDADADLSAAIGAFQEDNGIAVTGESDEATINALVDKHGS